MPINQASPCGVLVTYVCFRLPFPLCGLWIKALLHNYQGSRVSRSREALHPIGDKASPTALSCLASLSLHLAIESAWFSRQGKAMEVGRSTLK